jgi:4-amino-4-deoxy-L-arabinose transferase-like glycosyltransferase
MIKLTQKEELKCFLLLFLILFIYFWNFWYNAIWIPNESFYAEAVREMFESGNFLDIYYNYEPRFKKPPLTYWSIALSVFIFGVNEFAIRLPIILMALGSSFLTYKIAQILFNKKVALFSFFAMALSFQFIMNSRYASPEIPLLFFFTLTLYLFLKGYKENRFLYIFFSYISFGLTVLTKGYPYIFIIAGIIGLYILIESNFNIKQWLLKIWQIKLYVGIPIVFLIGLSWLLYMHFKFGSIFWKVYNEETIKRAFEGKLKFSDLFFYIIVILWGFLPYSLVFYFSFLNSYKRWFKDFSFVFSWIFVMFVAFTIVKAKLPTYFIQAFPALSVFVGYYMANYYPEGFKKYLWYLTFFIPSILITITNLGLVYFFNLSYFYYLICVFPFLYLLKYRDYKFLPFLCAVATSLIFTISLLIKIENYRPYKEIGRIINQKVMDTSFPLIIEKKFFYNLPFYAKRKVLGNYDYQQILDYKNKNKYLLALVSEESIKKLENAEILWSGYLYPGSESRLAIFLKNIYKAEKGDFSGFIKMYLVISY